MTEATVEPLASPDPAATNWVPIWSLNGGMDLRYWGDYAPGSYTDGDIVIYQGVTYVCVRPTTAAPTPWTPAQLTVAYGTSLPAAPVDGQEAVLVDSLTNPSYQWRFRYNVGSSSAYKWEFVGGSPAYVDSLTQVTVTNNWTNVGPSVVVARAGIYRCRASAEQLAAGTGGGTTFFVGAGLSTDSAGQGATASGASTVALGVFGVGLAHVSITATAGATISIWAHGGANGVTCYVRTIEVMPIRVS